MAKKQKKVRVELGQYLGKLHSDERDYRERQEKIAEERAAARRAAEAKRKAEEEARRKIEESKRKAEEDERKRKQTRKEELQKQAVQQQPVQSAKQTGEFPNYLLRETVEKQQKADAQKFKNFLDKSRSNLFKSVSKESVQDAVDYYDQQTKGAVQGAMDIINRNTKKTLDAVKRNNLYTGVQQDDNRVDDYIDATTPQQSDLTADMPINAPDDQESYIKDAWADINIKRNEGQAKNWQAKKVLLSEFEDMKAAADEASDGMRKLELLRQWSRLNGEYTKALKTDPNARQRYTRQLIEDITNVKDRLQQEYAGQVNPNQFNEKFLLQEHQRIFNNYLDYDKAIKDFNSYLRKGVTTKWYRQAGLWLHRNDSPEDVKNNSDGSIAHISGAISKVARMFTDKGSKWDNFWKNMSGLGHTDNWVGDDVDEAAEVLGDDYLLVSGEEQKRRSKKYEQYRKAKREYWTAAQKQDEQEANEWRQWHKVSNYYQHKAQTASPDLITWDGVIPKPNWDNILYTQASQAGYSLTSVEKQMTAIPLQVAATISEVHPGLSAAFSAAGAGLSYQQGIEENRQTIMEDLTGRMRKTLTDAGLLDKVLKEGHATFKNVSDDEILNMMAAGDWVPNTTGAPREMIKALDDAIKKGRQGALATFDKDMAATATESLVEFVAYSAKMPRGFGGAVSKGWNEAAKYIPVKVATTASRAVAATGRAASGIAEKTGATRATQWAMAKAKDVSASKVGRAAAAATDYTKQFVKRSVDNYGAFGSDKISTALGGVAGATKTALQEVNKLAGKSKYLRFGRQKVVNAANSTTELFTKIPKSVINYSTNKIADKNRAAYVNHLLTKGTSGLSKFTKRNYGIGFAESIEEGKQYLNGKEWLENEDPDRVASFMDCLLTDMSNGTSLITAAMGVPFGARWGLAADDAELYSNMTGGWFGGAGHDASVAGLSLFSSTVGDYIMNDGPMSVTKAIVHNTLLDNSTSSNLYFQGHQLAKQLFRNPEKFDQEFEEFEQLNARRREAGQNAYTEEEIAAEKEYIKKLRSTAALASLKGSPIAKALDMAGIKPGTDDFYKFVSAYTLYSDRMRDANAAVAEQEQGIETLVNQLLGAQLDANTEAALAASILGEEADVDENRILQLFRKPVPTTAKEAEQNEVANMTTKQRKEHERRLKKDKKYQEKWAAKFAEDVENESVAAQQQRRAAQAESNDDILKRGISTLARIKAIKTFIETIETADQYAEKRSHNDVAWMKEKLNDELENAMRGLNKDAVEDLLENIAGSVEDMDTFNELVSAMQAQQANKLDVAAIKLMQTTLLNPKKEATKVDRKLLKIFGVGPKTRNQSKALGLIDAMDRNISAREKLLFNIEQEYQSRDVRAEQAQRNTRIQETAINEEIADIMENGEVLGESGQQISQQDDGSLPVVLPAPGITEAPEPAPAAPEVVPEPVAEPQPTVVPEPTSEPTPEPEQNSEPTPEPEPTNTGFGSRNTIFTEDVLQDALAQLRSMTSAGGHVGMGINPAVLLEVGVKIMGYCIEGGARQFVDVVIKTVETLKDNNFENDIIKDISKNFKKWYMAATVDENFDAIADQFDDRGTVNSVSVEDLVNSVLDGKDVDAEKKRLWEEFKQSLITNEGFSHVVDSINDVLSLSAKEGQKIAVVNEQSRTYEQYNVLSVKNGKVDRLTNNAGILIMVDGVMLPIDQQMRLEDYEAAHANQVAQAVFEKLESMVDADNSNVVGVTSHDYVIEEGGKKVLYPRVHSYLPDQFDITTYEQELEETNRPKIQEFIDNGDIQGLIEFLKEERTGIDPIPQDTIDIYVEVLKQDHTQDDVVVDALVAMTSHIPPGIAVDIGTIVDDIVRVFFDADAQTVTPLTWEDYKTPLRGKQINISQIMPKGQFENLIKDLERFKVSHPEWLFSTKHHTWHTTITLADGSTIRVAGETDIVAVDPNGKIHIIDTKTSSKSWLDVVTPMQGGNIIENAFERIRTINKPEYVRDSSGALYERWTQVTSNRTTREQYSMQLSWYAAIVQKCHPDLQLAERPLSLLPVNLRYKYRDLVAFLSKVINGESVAGMQYPLQRCDVNQHGEPMEIELELQNDILPHSSSKSNVDINAYKKKVQDRIDAVNRKFAELAENLRAKNESLVQKFGPDGYMILQKFAENMSQQLQDFDSIDLDHANTASEVDVVSESLEYYETLVNDLDNELEATYAQEYAKNAPVKDEEKTQRQKDADTINEICSEIVALSQNYVAEFNAGKMPQAIAIYAQMKQKIDQLKIEMNRFSTYPNPSELQWASSIIQWFDAVKDPNTINTSQPQIPARRQATTGRVKTKGWSDYNSMDRRDVEKRDSEGYSLMDVTGNEDFAREAVCEVKGFRTKKGVAYFTVEVTYKGHTYLPVEVEVNTQEGVSMVQQYYQLIGQRKKGEKIILTGMFRTEGIPNNEGVERNVLDTPLVNGNIYDISMDSSQSTFGISKIDKGSGSLVIVAKGAIQSHGRRSESQLYRFKKGHGVAGGLYAVIRNYFINADGSSPEPMHVRIQNTPMTEGDIDLLIHMFETYQTSAYEADMGDGTFANLPLSHKDIIKLFFPIGKWNATYNTAMNVRMDQGRVIFSFAPTQENPTGTQTFDLSSDSDVLDPSGSIVGGKPALRKFLAGTSPNINEDLLLSRLGHATSNEHPFKKLASWFNNPRRAGVNKIQLGSSRMTFTREDFSNPTVDGDTNGISGLAWMMKNGMLSSTYVGISNPRVSFTKIELIGQAQTIESAAPEQTTADASIVVGNPADMTIAAEDQISIDDILSGGDFEHKQAFDTDNTITEESATAGIRRIFGNKVSVEVAENISKFVRKCSAHCVGKAVGSTIYLATRAQAGSEYHEAFHTVSKYILPKKMRDYLMKGLKHVMERKFGKEFTEQATDKNYEELGAELCRLYFNRTGKIRFDIKHVFDYIKQHYEAFKEVGSFRMYMLYMAMNSGLFKYVGTIEESEEDLNLLRYQVRDKYFEHVYDDRMYDTLIRSILPYIMKAQNASAIDHTMGRLNIVSKDVFDIKYKIKTDKGIVNYSIRELAHQSAVLRDKDGKAMITIDSDGKKRVVLNQKTIAAIDEMLDNWDVVKPDMISYLEELGVDYQDELELQREDLLNGDEEDIGKADGISEHTKLAYEESRMVKVSPSIRFFLSFIKKYAIGSDGNQKPRANELGLFEYMDHREVINIIFSDCHDVKSPTEMIERFKTLAKTDKMYKQIYETVKNVYDHQTRKNGTVNANNEQFITQLFNLISCAEMQFKRAYAYKGKKDGTYTISIQDCGQGYEAARYRQDWGKMLAYGGTEYFRLLEDGRLSITKPEAIQELGKLFDNLMYIKSLYQNTNIETVLHAKEQGIKPKVDVFDENVVRLAKRRICETLNAMGIQFSYLELNYMLKHEYKDAETEFDQLKAFLQDTSVNGIGNLWKNFVITQSTNGWAWNVDSNNADPNKRNNIFGTNTNVRDVYKKNSFVSVLSNYKYRYQHATIELSVLVADNKYYTMSDNNHISDVTDEINKGDKIVEMLSQYCYNLDTDQFGNHIGSIIVKAAQKAIKEGRQLDMQVCTVAEFKTNDKADKGAGYFDIGEAEDYTQKAVILEDGGLIFPTMSDKKTWVYISGLDIPGIKYKRDLKGNIEKVDLDETGALDQLLQYAITERNTIEQTIGELKTGIADTDKVGNYHSGMSVTDKNNNVHKIANGTVFASLCGIYREDGTYISFNRVLDENGNYISPEDNLALADAEFFNKSDEEKYEILKRIMDRQTDAELKRLEEIGLVQQATGTTEYNNIGLNMQAIRAIAKQIKEGTHMTDTESLRLATRRYVRDTVERSIMSIQEVERVYSGHPGFFKYEFKEIEVQQPDGRMAKSTVLTNRSADEFKRFGGLISTGVNNNPEIPGIPENGCYNQAEINDEEITSEQLDELTKVISYSTWYTAYVNVAKAEFGYEEACEKAKSMKTEELMDYVSKFPSAYKLTETSLKQEIASYEDGINVADGSAFISPEMTEWLLRMCGEYDSKVQKAFEILNDPNTDVYKNAEAYRLVQTKVIGAQKYTAYGMRPSRDGKTMIPYYNKMALFPVFKCIAKGRFAKVFDQMQNNTDAAGNPMPVHILCMKSAVKFGNQGTTDYSDNDSYKFNVYQQPFSRIRKQFNTNPKHKEDQSMGTQMVKVALASLIHGKVYTDESGNSIKGRELLDRIMQNISNLTEEGFEEVREKLYDGDKISEAKLSKFLEEMLTSRDADKSIKDSIQEKDGKLKHPLAAISRLGWLQSIIVSFINKRIVEVHTKGNAFYQRSIWKMEADRSSIGDDTMLPDEINGGKPLQTVIEDGPAKGAMDCVLTMDYFHDVLKAAGLVDRGKDKDGKRIPDASFEEQKQALMEAGIIGPNAKALFIGYRIPTQAQSSIHALRCVDVVPVINHNIFLPKDFTKITGSDFDIDKIFIASNNFILKHDGSKWTNDVDGVNKNKKMRAQNQLIEDYVTILRDPASLHIGLRSIDNDTALLNGKGKDGGVKGVLTDIEEGRQVANEVMPYDFYCLRTHTAMKTNFLTGKVGIGPFALNNNSHILTMLYDVKFAANSLMNRIGHGSLARDTDDDGNQILSWISALINAHVDVAKDAYITRLNVNPMTYNLVNLLIRTGYGKQTFYFTTQPVMKEMALEYTKAQGHFMQEDGKTSYQLRNEAKRAAAVRICGEETLKKWEAVFLNPAGMVDEELFAPILSELMTTPSLRNMAKGSTSGLQRLVSIDATNLDEEDKVLTYEDYQALVYLADKAFEKPAQAISDLVQYSKIDTKKQGKSVSEQIAYAKGVAKVFGDQELLYRIYGGDKQINGKPPVDRDTSMFDKESIQRLYTESFIKDKTHKAIITFMDVMRGQVLEACPGFQRIVVGIAEYLGHTDTYSLQKISDAVQGKIKASFINDYATKNGINIPDLVSGNNSIYDRLNRIQIAITTDPKYSDMRDANGEIKNPLLKLLAADYVASFDNAGNVGGKPDKFDELKFVRLFDPLDVSAAKRDYLIQAWEDLLKDNDTNHEELRKFAEDLCVYAFVTSADKGGSKTIFSYVPNYWREESGYVEYMRRMLNSFDDPNVWPIIPDEYIDDIVLNNWNDYTFVANVDIWDTAKNSKGWHTAAYTSDVDGYKSSFPCFLSCEEAIPNDEIRPFVKVKRTQYGKNNGSHRQYVVFKLVHQIPITNTSSVPVYVKINPRGYSVNGYNYYEYGSARKIDTEYFPNIEVIRQNKVSLLQNPDKLIMQFGQNTVDILNKILNATYIPLGRRQVETLDMLKTQNRANEGTYTISEQSVGEQPQKYGKVKYYGPTMGKTTAAKSNPNLVDFDDIVRDDIKVLADSLGKSVRQVKIESGEEYKKLLLNAIVVWQANPENEGKTLVISNAVLSTEDIYDNEPMIPSKEQFVKRQVERNPELTDDNRTQLEQEAGQYYDDLIARNPNLKIEDRFVSELEGESKFGWAVTSPNNYEVSSAGDSRFSAMKATFKPGTMIHGHDVGGRTIESVYQHGIKQDDWVTNNNNKTGAPRSKHWIIGNTTEDSYYEGYLPLWQEWARQNPELIEELRQKAQGKVLTDKFVSKSTTVSQARALADILNGEVGEAAKYDADFAKILDGGLMQTSHKDNAEIWAKTPVGYESTSDKILDFIINKSDNEHYRELAKSLKKILEHHPVSIKFLEYGFGGVYDNESHSIEISREAYHVTETMLHELVHAATSIALDSNPELAAAFDAIREYVLEQLNDIVEDQDINPQFLELTGVYYGLVNDSHEFVAEFMSNPVLQALLKKMKPMEKKKYDSLFDQVIDVIKNALRRLIGKNDSAQSLFDQIEPMVKNLINYQYMNFDELKANALNRGVQHGFSHETLYNARQRVADNEYTLKDVEILLRNTGCVVKRGELYVPTTYTYTDKFGKHQGVHSQSKEKLIQRANDYIQKKLLIHDVIVEAKTDKPYDRAVILKRDTTRRDPYSSKEDQWLRTYTLQQFVFNLKGIGDERKKSCGV